VDRDSGRLGSAADTTEVVVVRAPTRAVDLCCGGSPMVAVGGTVDPPPSLDPAFAKGSQLGKRYVDEGSGLEVLCTKPGEGSLSVGPDFLQLKDAKPLPSSD